MVRIAVIGLGNRACKYLEGIGASTECVRVVAVAEPNPLRRERVAIEYGIGACGVFPSAEELFASEVDADAVIVASPDATHYACTMSALERGWNVLLEKPVALNLEECLEMEALAAEKGLLVAVCFELRYNPLYLRLKGIVASSGFGRLISVHHRIDIGLDRMSHSFVRGLWAKESESSPIVLSKASHDVDLLLWICGENVSSLSSSGSLDFYVAANCPAEAALRCIDCPLESNCRFSAVDLYLRRNEWNRGFDVKPGESGRDAVMRELLHGRYGRCVFRCDNDVPDNQVVDMTLASGASVHIEIDGRTDRDARETSFVFENAVVSTDGYKIVILRSDDGTSEEYDMTECVSRQFHAGADAALVRDFIAAVSARGSAISGADLRSAILSHQICFMAERSRKRG